jgi:hypothetical protein
VYFLRRYSPNFTPFSKFPQQFCSFPVRGTLSTFQSKAQQVMSKNPFFQNFFYPFYCNDLTKTALLKLAPFSHQSRMFALTKEGSYYI